MGRRDGFVLKEREGVTQVRFVIRAGQEQVIITKFLVIAGRCTFDTSGDSLITARWCRMKIGLTLDERQER